MKVGPTMGEKELAHLCAKGDRSAIRELYGRYAARLCALCSRYAGGPEEGMDLMHDSLLKALDKMDKYQYSGPGSLYSWLARVAVNESIDHLRKGGRLQMTYKDDPLPERDSLIAEESPAPEESRSIPDADLQRMISSLPDSKRVVLNLYCVEGFSHKEIGEKLGISKKTSSSTLARAKKTLAEKIKEYWKNNG